MKAKLKKALAMLLALCLAVSLAPMALAADASNCVMLDVPWDYIEQCGNQHDSGNTGACQCYCWAYCRIILDNKVHTWEEYRDGDSGQTAKAPSAAGYESATNTASKQTLLEAVYDNINIGRPVVLRCKGSVNYHFTVAIGYKADCDPSNLDESDIIILNPSQGTVQTLADVTLKTSKNKYGYWITNSGGANVITTEKVPTTITFNSLNTPSTTVGKSTNITGTITSTGSKIKSINAVVTDSSGNTKLSKTVSSLSTYSYTLKKSALDKGLTFGKLAEGSYTLKYTVTTADGTTDTEDTTVTVKGTQTNITFDSLNSLSVTEGKAANITGTIKSTGSKIQSIKAVVTDSSGNTKLSKTVSSLSTNSYTLKRSALDMGLSFSKLSAGSYTLKYTVTTADGTTANKSVSVTVK
ncbi:MAG: hypothetical protein LIO57_09530 [Oscillospiraceae bacterium]|nr:hypothetical protein [Oscillospiraceae bacterium]